MYCLQACNSSAVYQQSKLYSSLQFLSSFNLIFKLQLQQSSRISEAALENTSQKLKYQLKKFFSTSSLFNKSCLLAVFFSKMQLILYMLVINSTMSKLLKCLANLFVLMQQILIRFTRGVQHFTDNLQRSAGVAPVFLSLSSIFYKLLF